MKKLLIFMLVLGLASVSQAVLTTFVVDGDQEYVGTAGETIQIDLVSDTAWSGTIWEGIVEASAVTNGQAYDEDIVDMGGAVGSAVVYTSAAVSIGMTGYQDNYLGNLVSTVAADVSAGALSPGTVAVSFDYTISSGWDGTTDYWVAPLISGETYTYDGGSFTVGATYSALGIEGNVLIEGLHIIPEPMTVLLLGLGGLFLRRRR